MAQQYPTKRPDGKIPNVRSLPLPGGGSFLINLLIVGKPPADKCNNLIILKESVFNSPERAVLCPSPDVGERGYKWQ
ncbi:MAG: hypothetical protein LBP68_03135 [Acidobacteriota bacterium]|nr:hypothetical protein [Acidobacteriota bacterium]